jgi:hypothetical protein
MTPHDKDPIPMNSERTQAYGRVVKTLDELGPAKLQPAEQDRVREAADTLIFAAGPDEARGSLEDVDALAEHLVASGRWSEERAQQLVEDVLACGPVSPVAG